MLHTWFFSKVLPIIIFVIVPSNTKVIDSPAYMLHFALITSEQIYNASAIAVKTMINKITYYFLSTEL